MKSKGSEILVNYTIDEWKIIENEFIQKNNRISESIMSIGNGHFGMRGNFEEQYSGDSLQGTYIAGIYYPDKTRVGWWKNGYPEYFAKVLNTAKISSLDIKIDNIQLDLNFLNVVDFKRTLDMKRGVLKRSFTALVRGNRYEIESIRFASMKNKEYYCQKYSITSLDKDSTVFINTFIDGNVKNEDSNYNEMFWEPNTQGADNGIQYMNFKTKKTNFNVNISVINEVKSGNKSINNISEKISDMYISEQYSVELKKLEKLDIYKYVALSTDRDCDAEYLKQSGIEKANKMRKKGFVDNLNEHVLSWENIWKHSDIIIKGDKKAQQGIRFNIFQLNQTYTGDDSRLNIGPKGFTGEKYGGSTYWDTEAFCIPFYLGTSKEKVSRNLLEYRYNQLDKAIENASKLGLKGALYPMVTMNGEECHNEWEITFEEIHRNAAISYAIYNYTKYTGDDDYLLNKGIDVLVNISRFWADRATYNSKKDKWMILGVTGPNEYENNVNNNWYTNRMASWNLEYAIKVINDLKSKNKELYLIKREQLNLNEEELIQWESIISNMHYPYIEDIGVFEQQDGFLDKEIIPANQLKEYDLPINQKWSWDRILRSCYIKQADVLQGLFFLSHLYDLDTKKRNYDFYLPLTLHESSLSPCVHSIIACEIGYLDDAGKLFNKTSRLDLDDCNKDTSDGLHITSMAGTWMSVVHGFGGLRIKDDMLTLTTSIPKEWMEYSFNLCFRNRTLRITVNKTKTKATLLEGNKIEILLNGKKVILEVDNNEIS